MLGGMVVVVWTAVWAMPYFLLIKKCCLRVNKVDELIGLDVAQYILGIEPVENFI